MKKIFITILILFAASAVAFGQKDTGSPDAVFSIKSSPAYAEILLSKTELLADIDAFGADYTEASTKMIELRAELASLDRSLEKVFAVRPSETGKLTQGLGKLIVKKAELDADLDKLSRKYSKEHPETRRAQRRVDRFEAAIAEILK
jgi:uncharacterized protein involved in exopolysaccharide biosynthesis